MKLLVVNGPSINMLGIREKHIYGEESFKTLLERIKAHALEIGVEVETYQSNHEGDLIDAIQQSYFDHVDGIIINPGAYTHTSIALLDALKSVDIPYVEVHISDIREREDFRQISYAGMACVKTFMGLGFEGYRQAILFLKDHLSK